MNFLHVGCGHSTKENAKGFEEWDEVRYDIDESVKPDVIGSITDMSNVQDNSYDAIYSSHNIEHVYAHEVLDVIGNFHRVLKPDGYLVITCPDLKSICEFVVQNDLLDTVYVTQGGYNIKAMDMIFGHIAQVQQGRTYMQHKCGFSPATLSSACQEAGFKTVVGGPRKRFFDLWFICSKVENDPRMGKLIEKHLP